MYADDAILLGYVYTDEAIQFSGDFPTVAIESGFEKNPQMIMWDPATYPDVKGIADLGKTGVKVRYFGGAAYMDFLTGRGILSNDQVDGSYDGDPSLFIADEGKAAQQGFGSAEPYLYENELTGLGQARQVPVHQRRRLEELRRVDRHQAGEHRRKYAAASRSWCRSSSRPASTTSTTRPAPTRSSSTPSPSSVTTSAGCTTRARPTTRVEDDQEGRPGRQRPRRRVGNFDIDSRATT